MKKPTRRLESRRKVSTLGQRLREARETQGFTVRELAAKVGTSHPNIVRIETGYMGRRSVQAKLLTSIAETLGYSTDWLLGRTNDRLGLQQRIAELEQYVEILEAQMRRRTKAAARGPKPRRKS